MKLFIVKGYLVGIEPTSSKISRGEIKNGYSSIEL